MKIPVKALIFCWLTFVASAIYAHPGGHYSKADYFNTWQLANGKTVKGNFSMSVNNMVILEQAEGKFIAVPLSQLSSRYQTLAKIKINRLKRLNEEMVNSPYQAHSQTGHRYLEPLIAIVFSFLILAIMFAIARHVSYHKKRATWGIGCTLLLTAWVFYAFKPDYLLIPKSNPDEMDLAFAPYKPSVATSWDALNFYVSSNGIPNHNMMVGIKNWQQQVPLPQNYTGPNSWTIPLQPVYAANPLSTKRNFMRGAVAIAVNGIPIFNALNNRGEDSFSIGELDQWGGHCGKGDDYHYHAAPLSLQAQSGLKPIAFCLDGFAVYGNKEPDGANMLPLDSCHGHVYKNGVYHYHGTTNYPYVIGALRGVVKMDDASLAPENQIMPQAFTTPLRPPTRPLRGAVITDFKKLAANSFMLSYQVEGKPAYIGYSWDDSNHYTFNYIDPAGTKTTETYVRKPRPPKR